MKIAIIIPGFNRYDLTHARLMELYKYVQVNAEVEIILINDASTDEDYETGCGWWKNHSGIPHKIRYYKNKENLGFIGSMNIGAKIAIKNHADLLIFLSNDVVISGNFVAEILKALEPDANTLIGGEMISHAAGWNEFQHENYKFHLPWLNGWMLACTDVIWQSLGGFDKDYAPSDFEDVDLSTTAIDLGYKLIPLNSQHLKHLTAQSFGYNETRLARTKRNRELYISKWTTSKLRSLHRKIQSN